MGLTSIVLTAALSMTANTAQPAKQYAPPPKPEVRIERYAVLRDDRYEAEQRIAQHRPFDDDVEPRDGFRKADYARRMGAK